MAEVATPTVTGANNANGAAINGLADDQDAVARRHNLEDTAAVDGGNQNNENDDDDDEDIANRKARSFDSHRKQALTPPTSEDLEKDERRTRARSSSELSELGPDIFPAEQGSVDDGDDDGEVIEPDHYFGGGRIPVFKPVSFCLLYFHPETECWSTC